MVQLLIQAGADLTAVNADGDLPSDLAEGDRIVDIFNNEMQAHGLTEEALAELRQKPEKEFTAMVQQAIDSKSDLNAKNAEGATLVCRQLGR